jgi:hypothetical protein
MMADYADVICQAVDTIVSKKLEGIHFDTTIKCTVTDVGTAEEGKYTVSNGSTTFTAYANDTAYKVNDVVYVTIPNGDYAQQKLIAGKSVSSSTAPFIYTSPFDAILDASTNLVLDTLDPIGLTANSEKSEILIWNYDFTTNNKELTSYNTLGISAEFRSWLSSMNTTNGEYGLKLLIHTRPDVTIGAENEESEDYVLYLSINDMYGNPYNFNTYYTQEKTFDISNLGTITNMQLFFYQVPGSFTNSDGELISHSDFLGNDLAANLFVRNPYICVGYDIEDFADEQAILYTLDYSTYTSAQSVENKSNNKTIQLRWLHEFDDGAIG